MSLEDSLAEDSQMAAGAAAIRRVLKTLPPSPGVYRMLDRKGDAVYVGKARNLKARVQHYTNLGNLSTRLRRMVAETTTLEVVVTHTEVEALLLENNLIKKLMPRYNVLLRDDKSFPFIAINAAHDFPQLSKHRGPQDKASEYFGPFASAGAVNRTLIALQRAFLLRSCSDSMFASRTRPCLLYQIKRCSAPCVGRIDRDSYARFVAEARDFLRGRGKDVQSTLAQDMQAASAALDFEAAALIRDRIRALTHVQGQQDINVQSVADADVIAAHQAGGQTSIQVFFFRGGQNWGNRAYFPSHDRQLPVEEVLASFLGQFYDNKPPPPLILLSHALAEAELIAEALSIRAERKVTLLVPQRGERARLLGHALNNAREALGRRVAESASQRKLLEGVAATFGLEAPPRRIEVYDNSHIQGTNAVGAMIVAGPEGLMKSAYRKFNIRGGDLPSEPASAPPLGEMVGPDDQHREGEEEMERPVLPPAAALVPGDDYGMMREVLVRRLARALKEDPERARGAWPDLILVDGGAGQLSVATEVLGELGITDVAVAAIAKGPDRNAGRERFFVPGKAPFSLDPRDPILYLLQRLRDEAHRFAIGTHRARRAKSIGHSLLDDIPGIGASRKKALLHHFGSARTVARAGLAELERVDGISKRVAKKIYEHFHVDG
ncbi:MAG TPA: excinuclease ABC subunit UvrC [Stellaceae bacterium]|nr:excinuclease ABC subunit UvrC [Stellaceae bacterium]